MIRRMLMRRDQELVDFEVDPATGEVHVIEASEASADLLGFGEMADIIKKRAISGRRADMQDVLESLGAQSPVHLTLMGHGLSLSDQFWYRAPGGTERWEDINFFDNEWDPRFGAAVFKRDYSGLASCSPDTPDATTCGRAVKMWERGEDGIYLVKESLLPDGSDLVGAKLSASLCAQVFDEGCCIPMAIVERYGKPCSASPLMLVAGEEFADGNRLRAIAGMREEPGKGDGDPMSTELFQSLIEAYMAVGVSDASAHIARVACCHCLTFTMDFHSGNFGIIRKVGANALRPAPIFDFEGSFGIPVNKSMASTFIANIDLAKLYCASRFSSTHPGIGLGMTRRRLRDLRNASRRRYPLSRVCRQNSAGLPLDCSPCSVPMSTVLRLRRHNVSIEGELSV